MQELINTLIAEYSINQTADVPVIMAKIQVVIDEGETHGLDDSDIYSNIEDIMEEYTDLLTLNTADANPITTAKMLVKHPDIFGTIVHSGSGGAGGSGNGFNPPPPPPPDPIDEGGEEEEEVSEEIVAPIQSS